MRHFLDGALRNTGGDLKQHNKIRWPKYEHLYGYGINSTPLLVSQLHHSMTSQHHLSACGTVSRSQHHTVLGSPSCHYLLQRYHRGASHYLYSDHVPSMYPCRGSCRGRGRGSCRAKTVAGTRTVRVWRVSIWISYPYP